MLRLQRGFQASAAEDTTFRAASPCSGVPAWGESATHAAGGACARPPAPRAMPAIFGERGPIGSRSTAMRQFEPETRGASA
ncbi:MAG: hypothetical protein DCC70_09725 [Burkholderiales bacterium]|nr:MAG: hypothetical protein EDM78_05795 [Pseudomonadota bacterium]RIK89124.1 MAG: hypothetical protein DCC70_09725 [Burkholderiales bacterium]